MAAQSIRLLLIEDNPGGARFLPETMQGAPHVDIHHMDRLGAES